MQLRVANNDLTMSCAASLPRPAGRGAAADRPDRPRPIRVSSIGLLGSCLHQRLLPSTAIDVTVSKLPTQTLIAPDAEDAVFFYFRRLCSDNETGFNANGAFAGALNLSVHAKVSHGGHGRHGQHFTSR
jgi:hypothetical protein